MPKPYLVLHKDKTIWRSFVTDSLHSVKTIQRVFLVARGSEKMSFPQNRALKREEIVKRNPRG